MSNGYVEIEAEIRFLTTEEGGRKSGVYSGYRGQFFYQGDDYDGVQSFPDSPDSMIPLGTTVRASIRFRQERWEDVHSKRITVGMPFEIKEGNRIVGRGIVKRV